MQFLAHWVRKLSFQGFFAMILATHQRFRLRDLLRYNPRTVRAYLLKEDFQQFWEYESPAWAAKFLAEWRRQTMRSRIQPMKKIARMLRARRDLILNYFKAKKLFSSGVLEGLNSKAKVTTWRTGAAVIISRTCCVSRTSFSSAICPSPRSGGTTSGSPWQTPSPSPRRARSTPSTCRRAARRTSGRQRAHGGGRWHQEPRPGARDIDESGRPVRLPAGALVSSPPFALDEDSEIRLQVQELAP
jgi:hypothetical protein